MSGVGGGILTFTGMVAMSLRVAMIAVRFVQHLGFFKAVAFAGNTGEECGGSEEVKRLHRQSF
jgi:hypothetical protein